MSGERSPRIDYRTEDGIVTATIDPGPTTAEHDLLWIIADIEGVDIDSLPSLYREVDHFVEHLFETPPSTESQMDISFSYAGYRVTMTGGGAVKLVPVKESVPDS